MPLVADRVKETSTTTGAGAFSLDGPVTNFRSFVNGIGDAKECYYAIIHRTAAEWEVGIGTVAAGAPDALSRDAVLSSSNGGNAVTFSAGIKDVFVTLPSDEIMRFQHVVKSVDQAVVSSATLQDDSELALKLKPNTKYTFKFFIRVTTVNATADVRIALNGPAAPAGFWAHLRFNRNNGDAIAGGGIVTAYDTVGPGANPNWGGAIDLLAKFEGYIKTGADVAQPLVLRWAQRLANANATTVKAGSWLELLKM